MTCNECGKQLKNAAKDFPKAVVEISNPETLVLFRKMVIPASMGTEEDVPVTIGKYRNVLLQYEANDHIYLYSSDGIPTAITASIPQEILDSITKLELETVDLQQQIDDLKNSPDVVDIVPTYVALQAYDTSKLGDNDIVRVLVDETHDGQSTYYRWDATAETWIYIGAVGDYYTKAQVDNLLAIAPAFKPFPDSVVTDGTTQQFLNSILALNPETGMAYLGTVSLSDMPAGLVQEEVEVYIYSDYVAYAIMRSTDVYPYAWWCASYNYQGWKAVGGASNTIFYANASATGNTRYLYEDSAMTTKISMQDLITANERGQVIVRITTASDPTSYSDSYLQNAWVTSGDYQMLFLDEKKYSEYSTTTPSSTTFTYLARTIQDKLTAGANVQINGATISATDTTYSTFIGTDGQTDGSAGLVPAPTATDVGKVLGANGAWVADGPTVVQTTGTSTADVMSQNATTDMIYNAARNGVNIGSSSSSNINGVAIGGGASAAGESVAIGKNSSSDTRGVTVGEGASSTAYSVAIGNDSTSGDSTQSTKNSVAVGFSTAATGNTSVAVGEEANASATTSVAIGSYASATTKGQFDISTGSYSNYGYNNTGYRLLTGLHDPQSNHDAATKNYADTVVRNVIKIHAGTPSTTTTGSVGQLLEDITNGKLYQCIEVDDSTTPIVYTWGEMATVEQISWRQRKPVVVWEVDGTTITTGLVGVGEDISANPNWQLTDLDLTPYKRLKIFSKAAQKAGSTASASTTPAIILEMSLDPRAAIAEYGGNYVASNVVQKPNDPNRLCTLCCAVSADKTKFEVLRMTNLYGTAATSNADVNAYVFKIEGYYD